MPGIPVPGQVGLLHGSHGASDPGRVWTSVCASGTCGRPAGRWL